MLINYWHLFNVHVKYIIFLKVYIQNLFLKNQEFNNFIKEHNGHTFDGKMKVSLNEDRLIVWKTLVTFGFF